ncbi:glutamic acid-rich protein-like [Oppia nitens]|uniref:glutamic acid-rich protein-like n=1 Tax=Oppia nitens TaxID=1686743 RepID=UPI0023DA6190|nr:glutamic acid-rich protein-like [Oppia nitens]
MPSTRSRSSTEAPEVPVEDKKIESSEQKEEAAEVKETTDKSETLQKTEITGSASESDNSNEKPVDDDEEEDDDEEDNKVDQTNDETSEDTNGATDKVENGSAKRKSIGDEAGDAPDSTDVVVTPKKAKVDAPAEESNGANNGGAGEQKETPLETTA